MLEFFIASSETPFTRTVNLVLSDGPNAEVRHRNTAHFAVMGGSNRLLQKVASASMLGAINTGDSVYGTDGNGWNALHLACVLGRYWLLPNLLQHCQVVSVDNNGRTLAMLAAISGCEV